MRIEISKNVEFQSDPILMLLCFVKGGVTHENFMRELCLFYKALNDLSRYARSSRDLMMYLVEMCIIMILLYCDIMTCTSRRDLMIDCVISSRSYDMIWSRSYDITIVLYYDIISTRYNRQISSRSWELTNGGVCGKMPRPYIFMSGVLTFFRGCAIIRSLRSQGSRGIKCIKLKGSDTIIRDYKGL